MTAVLFIPAVLVFLLVLVLADQTRRN